MNAETKETLANIKKWVSPINEYTGFIVMVVGAGMATISFMMGFNEFLYDLGYLNFFNLSIEHVQIGQKNSLYLFSVIMVVLLVYATLMLIGFGVGCFCRKKFGRTFHVFSLIVLIVFLGIFLF